MKGMIAVLLIVTSFNVSANPYQCFNYGDRCMCNPCQTGVCYGMFYDLHCVCHTMYRPLVVTLNCGKCVKVQRCHQHKNCKPTCQCP
jgi:hypothetical protein